MLTFKQFLLEVHRDKERAAKLGEYLVKRENRRNPDRKGWHDKFDLPAWHHERWRPDDDHDDEAFSKAYTYAHSTFKRRKKNIQDVPVKDLLKHNWQPVNFNKDYALKHKDKDERPMNVARSRKTGELDVVDGYHRLAWAWLQGKSHIKANLQDVGRKGKKK